MKDINNSVNDTDTDTDTKLMALATQLRKFDKYQGKPADFEIVDSSVRVSGYTLPVTSDYLALLGLYTVVQYDSETLKNMRDERWVDLHAVRHNHYLCVVGGNLLQIELKKSKEVVKTSVSIDTDSGDVTFKLASKGDINAVNVILASHLYTVGKYNSQFKMYIASKT